MMRLLVPLTILAAAIGLFVVYTNPTYQDIKALRVQVNTYDDALNKSQELKKVRDQLLSKFNTFSTDDKAKLQAMLPDNVDNIRLVIDINNIAARHSLALKNLQLGAVGSGASSHSALAVGSSGAAVGSVDLGFGVTASYEDFISFLQDLEHSLRILDVESMSLSVGGKVPNSNDYSVNIRTYWLH